MLRHGMTARGLWAAARAVAEHRAPASRASPCTCRWRTAPPSEVQRLMNDVVAAELPLDTIWVSHLAPPS